MIKFSNNQNKNEVKNIIIDLMHNFILLLSIILLFIIRISSEFLNFIVGYIWISYQRLIELDVYLSKGYIMQPYF